MYKRILFSFGCLLLCVGVFAQAPAKRALNAVRIHDKITIDGKLDEPIWQQAEKATGFTQLANHPGDGSICQTAVSILYDDGYVYIGAMMYDNPDSILKQLSARDDYSNNTDYFGVLFDTYFDKQNAFQFVVTAAGVQTDSKLNGDNEDGSWNTTWYSDENINAKGWSVEIKIPYTAIRFPNIEEQVWGVNFFRSIRRTRELAYWNKVEPQKQGLVGQSGVLNGIKEIDEPLRLALIPYASAYLNNYAGSNSYSINGGVDVKYGFDESFTLDMTLIPDFGQTRFDNKVLNLSPFEVKYDERRYFFTEGVDLFNKNDLFYSRRIGGVPVNINKPNDNLNTNEVVTDNPLTTRLYNATKITGRTTHNLGIGFFNAVSAPVDATITDTITHQQRHIQTSPLTNYNAIVLDQALKNNSYLSFINTNVTRKENSYNANVSALMFRFSDKPNKYSVEGSMDVSQIYTTSKPDIGERYYLKLGKISGNYTWKFNTLSISDAFNPNDMGYLDRNNYRFFIFDQNYNIYKPFGIVNRMYNHIGIDYYRVYNPDVFQKFKIDGSNFVLLKSYFAFGINYELQPFVGYDYYEPRTAGRFNVFPQNYTISGFISTDYRKKFALDAALTYNWFLVRGSNGYEIPISPRYRFSDKFSMIYSFSFGNYINDIGYVDKVNDSIYFGIRNVQTVTNSLTSSYIFTHKMSLRLDFRYYWSQAQYSKYNYLMNDGNLAPTNYSTNHNVSFNSFNVFLSYIWQFTPGSEVSIVFQNSIYSSGDAVTAGYFDNLRQTLNSPQSNSLSVKFLYYLDYQNVIRKPKL